MFSEATRAYVYRILLSLQPLSVTYGFLTETESALWINVGSAVLGLGLAVSNTSTKRGDSNVPNVESH